MRPLPRLLVLLLTACLLTAVPRGEALPAPVTATTGASTSAGTASAEPRAPRLCANGRPSRFYADDTRDGVPGVRATGIGVWNKPGDACYWVTATGSFNPERTQVIRVLVDTSLRYQGYEYEAWAYSDKDSDYRTTSHLIYWSSSKDSQYVSCRLYSAFGQREVRLGITKTCLGSPSRIRVHVEVLDITTYGRNNRYRGVGDQVPDRTFYTGLF